jgi:hypothetical protein
MKEITRVEGPLDDEARGKRIFGGHVLLHAGLASMARLRDFVDAHVRSVFAPHDPELAHACLPKQALFEAVEDARRSIAEDPRSAELFADVLTECGADVDATFWDKLTLRVLPPIGEHAAGPAAPIGFHRDAWSSQIYAQMNWWAPIRELARDRTFAIYPAYFDRAIENSSATWDPYAFLRAKREATDAEQITYPIVPEPTEPVDRSTELRILIAPGDLLVFASAHLHASVPNTSDRTRFSVEVRTVSLSDLARGAEAPNVDGARGQARYHWYRHLRSGERLIDVLHG